MGIRVVREGTLLRASRCVSKNDAFYICYTIISDLIMRVLLARV